jgi:glycosyltransferase involved in cell wall biosynthesis
LGWLNHRESRLIARVEKSVVRRAARVWALSRADAEAREEDGARVTKVVGLPPAVGPGVLGEPTHDVGLLGTWTWELNEAGLNWLLEEVRPLLADDVSIAIAGAGSERYAQESLPTVRGVGRVENAGAFLGLSRVIAIPAVATAGVQIKTLDALATGVPIVATSIALRGLNDLPSGVTVADDPSDFAEAVRTALQSTTVRADALHEARIWAERRRQRFADEIAKELEMLVTPERAESVPV